MPERICTKGRLLLAFFSPLMLSARPFQSFAEKAWNGGFGPKKMTKEEKARLQKLEDKKANREPEDLSPASALNPEEWRKLRSGSLKR